MTLRYANRYTERDILPFEVVDLISAGELVIREMSCDRARSWKPRMVMGHCLNESDQEWDITSDDEALTFRIRLNKYGEWKDACGNVYQLAENPMRFHRFSFVSGIYDADVEE